MTSTCPGFLPLLHTLAPLLLYLLPALLLALLIRYLSARHPAFFLFTLAGTICHELAHYSVGWLTGARPSGMTVVPRRVGAGWELGSVRLANVRWYNAAPMALAPLLVLALPFGVAWWRTRPGGGLGLGDIGLALLVAPQFLACWPSSTDWRIAARSWPLVAAALGLGWCCAHFAPGATDLLLHRATSQACAALTMHS